MKNDGFYRIYPLIPKEVQNDFIMRFFRENEFKITMQFTMSFINGSDGNEYYEFEKDAFGERCLISSKLYKFCNQCLTHKGKYNSSCVKIFNNSRVANNCYLEEDFIQYCRFHYSYAKAYVENNPYLTASNIGKLLIK